jgi:DNA-directed RNA polymerase sigma subunit (sigma70/sigma32)
VDAPVISPGSGSYKGSAAGGDGSNSQELLILDTLRCAEPKPEDQVEISFLRQCLENAMATELTPYERDVLRLRLGLDSGEGKTVREVVEICGGSVTMSDVRSAERRAFKKLRSPTSVHTHNLLEYLDLAGADKGTLFRR